VKLSVLIEKLQEALKEHGDLDVFSHCGEVDFSEIPKVMFNHYGRTYHLNEQRPSNVTEKVLFV
jgi:hypothetical protein